MRKADWENQLTEYLISVSEKPHAYGKHDCMIFAANVVRAQTGKDYARGHRGKYKSARGAKVYLKRLGFRTPAQMIGAHLKKKPIGFAQRGDIVAGRDGVPGVVMGDFAFQVGQTEEQQGLVRLPRAEWRRAWGV